MGIVMYEMITGRLPFSSRDYEKLFNLILTQEVLYPATLSSEAYASTRFCSAPSDGNVSRAPACRTLLLHAAHCYCMSYVVTA